MPHSATAKSNEIVDGPLPPDEFICPLTNEIMDDPVLSKYGNHFERYAIIEWLNEGGNTYCPLTSKPLRLQNLVSDKTLKWKINYWKKHHKNKNSNNKECCSGEVKSMDDSDRSSFSANNGNNGDNYIGPGEHILNCLGGSGGGGGLLCASLPDPKFVCPLTKDVMKDPMMSKTGYNFESKAILKYLEEVDCVCPVSGQPLFPSDLVSNTKLKWDIEQWLQKYGSYDVCGGEMTKLEYETKMNKAVMVSQDYHISDILKALTEIEVNNGNSNNEDIIDNNKKKKAVATIPEEKESEDNNVLDLLDDVVDTLEG